MHRIAATSLVLSPWQSNAFTYTFYRFASKWTYWSSSPRAEYIILPEVPSKSSIESKKAIPFTAQSVQGMDLFASISRDCMDTEMLLNDHFSRIADKYAELSFDEGVKPLNDIFAPLHEAYLSAHSLLSVQGNPSMSVILTGLCRKVKNIQGERFNNEKMYKMCANLNKRRAELTNVQQGFLDYCLLQFRVNGVHLVAADRLKLARSRADLLKVQEDFCNRVRTADRNFAMVLGPDDLSACTPYWLRKHLAVPGSRDAVEKGPWMASVREGGVLTELLKYVVDDKKRKTLYRARVSRNGSYSSQYTGGLNLSNVMDIRRHRGCIANVLGYRDWADWYCTERTRFGSLANVMKHLDEIRTVHAPKALEEYNTLNQWSKEVLGFTETLKQWDLPFVSKHYLLDKSTESLRYTEPTHEYLPQHYVVQSIPQVLNEVFHVQVTPQDADPSLILPQHSIIHPEQYVCWLVLQETSNEPLGWIVLDLYPRNDKHPSVLNAPLCYALQNRNSVTKQIPVSYIVASWHDSNSRQDGLSPQQVAQLWANCTLALQHILSNSLLVPFVELASPASLTSFPLSGQISPWIQPLDCHHVLQQSMIQLVLQSPEILSRLGRDLSVERATELLQGSSSFGSSLQLIMECYRAAVELELHVTDKYFHEVQCSLWDSWMQVGAENVKKGSSTPAVSSLATVSDITKVLAPERWDEWPCSDTDLLGYTCENTKLSSVNMICSQPLLLDLVSTFRDTNETLSAVGLRFRDTYLAFGAALNENELLKRFRGNTSSPLK